MKAKREFYLYGNDRKFHDDYIVSIMTGEPMPRKWQKYLELTPEEKARWDASLRLDAEYRVAEAQGFPNGIPGGKMRGNALYTFTQMEEEREHNLLKNQTKETLNPYGQYFSPHKTDIHDGTGDMFGNITPTDNLWQNPFDTWKNTDISASSAPQAENKPALDPLGLKQAIQRLTESVRASMNHANQEPQTIETESRDNAAMGIPANDSPTVYDRAQTDDSLVLTGTSLQEDENPPHFFAEDHPKIQNNVPSPTVHAKNQGVQPSNKRTPTSVQYKATSKGANSLSRETSSHSADIPILVKKSTPMSEIYNNIRNSLYELSSLHGEGIFSFQRPNVDEMLLIYNQNWDIVKPHLENEKDRLERSIDQAALDFFGSVDNILAMCPPNTKLAKVGGTLGLILLAIGAFRCILRVQKRRNDLIDHLMNKNNCQRSVAEAETLPIYHQWLLNELMILAGDDWIVDTLKGLWVPIEFTGNKDALML